MTIDLDILEFYCQKFCCHFLKMFAMLSLEAPCDMTSIAAGAPCLKGCQTGGGGVQTGGLPDLDSSVPISFVLFFVLFHLSFFLSFLGLFRRFLRGSSSQG